MNDHDRRLVRPERAQPSPRPDTQPEPLHRHGALPARGSGPSFRTPAAPLAAIQPRSYRLGHYLRNLSIITAPQLVRALAQQTRRQSGGAPIDLGTLLVSQGAISAQDLVMALLYQQIDRVAAAEIPPTARLGDLLVQSGAITAAQCASALYVQMQYQRPESYLRLGQVLLSQGSVTPRTLAAVLRMQQAARADT